MADTSEYFNVFDKNNIEILDSKIGNWYGNLMSQDSIIVAIARKAPRLLCDCKCRFGKLHNPDVVAISDIAVPFIDWEKSKRPILTSCLPQI